jgi:hypothetical protein
MKRMFHALVVLAMFSVVFFHGPLGVTASGISATTPVKVVVVSGTNYEMGVQYGEQAAKFIAVNRDIVWNILDTQVLDPDSGEPLGHSVIEKDIQVWTYYLEKHDLELKDWLLGIRRAAKTRGSRLVMRILSPSWFTRRKYGHVLCHLTLLKRVSSLPEYPRA